MRKEITIRDNSIQYGDIGQLHSSDIILHFEFGDKETFSIRADVAILYMLKGLKKEYSEV